MEVQTIFSAVKFNGKHRVHGIIVKFKLSNDFKTKKDKLIEDKSNKPYFFKYCILSIKGKLIKIKPETIEISDIDVPQYVADRYFLNIKHTFTQLGNQSSNSSPKTKQNE